MQQVSTDTQEDHTDSTEPILKCRNPCASGDGDDVTGRGGLVARERSVVPDERAVGASGIVKQVSEPERPAWKATARTLVLYNPKGQWRYAIYDDEGIVDGALLDVSAEVAPEEAQTRLLAEVEEMTEQRYIASWKQNEPHWWSADLIASS